MFCFFSVVSKVCHYVGSFFHYLLANSTENEEEKSVASVSAILFFILALQTGILIFFLKRNYGLSFWISLKIFKNNFLVGLDFLLIKKINDFYFIYSQGLTSLEPDSGEARGREEGSPYQGVGEVFLDNNLAAAQNHLPESVLYGRMASSLPVCRENINL